MVARLNGIPNSDVLKSPIRPEASRLKVNYNAAQTEQDPFRDPFSIDPMDFSPEEEIR